MQKGISIIVCCYNSALRLPQTIKYLAYQKVETEIRWEIIIVNNASIDNTKIVARKECEKYRNFNIDFFLVDQPTPGLSHARKKGIEMANYEYIIFCDDDNWLYQDYVENAYKIMESDSLIGAAGGTCEGITDGGFPEWFEEIKGPYAVGKQALKSGDLDDRLHLWGAGLVVRTKIMKKVFDEDFPLFFSGRKGELLFAGEDSEICARIILLGYKLHYSERLIFKHYIDRNKLTLEYKINMFNGFELASHIYSKYVDVINYYRLGYRQKVRITLTATVKMCYKYLKFWQNNEISITNNKNKLALCLGLPSLTEDIIIQKILKFKRSQMKT